MSIPSNRFHDERDANNIVLLLRAIWLLYKRQKWLLLAELGLPKERYQKQFLAVEMLMHRLNPSDEGTSVPAVHLSHPRHIALLIECDGVVEAAIRLQASYLRETGKLNDEPEQEKRDQTRNPGGRAGA